MKLLALATLATLAIAPLTSGQYFGISGGTNDQVLTNKSDSGLKVGYHALAKYGYKFASNIRAEAEIAYRLGRFKTVYHMGEKDVILAKEHNSIYSWSYMVNALYDINQLNVYGVTPYVGAGVGYCETTEKNKIQYDERTQEDKLKDKRFAYQMIGGLSYPITETVSAGVEYHYFVGRSHQKDHSVGMTLVRSF